MSWCEAEEPCGVSPARHGKCRGTRQLKPPAEQIIHPNPVTFAYLIVLFTWLAYHLVERVCSAGKESFVYCDCFFGQFVLIPCLLLSGFERCLVSSYKQQPFGRCMGGWAGHCISKESLVWEWIFAWLDRSVSQLMAVSGSTKLCFRIYLQVMVYVPVRCRAENHVLLTVLSSSAKGRLKCGA